jgi:hypothetical protein
VRHGRERLVLRRPGPDGRRDAARAGTVGEGLADPTAAGEPVNPRDERGDRLSDWPHRPRTKSLF